jgi:hypothetical protein
MRTLCLVVCLVAGASMAQGTSEYGSGLRWNLNPEGDRYIRAITWAQVWTRAIENNPGTTVDGVAAPWTTDVGLRRVRLLLYGQVHPRVLILTHLGINNQTFNNARKPGFFVHEAVVQFEAVKDALSIGAGLHYQNGISRMTSASTLNFLMMDAPIVNWPTIDGNDQFARNLGLYAKGKLSRLDYRFALNRPFTMTTEPAPGTTGYNPRANTLEGQFYVAIELLDRESNVLPYTVGTYLGSKRVLNFGPARCSSRRACSGCQPTAWRRRRTTCSSPGSTRSSICPSRVRARSPPTRPGTTRSSARITCATSAS